MPLTLTKTSVRRWSLDAGVAMVVTDLHGDWEAYARYRDRFVDRHAAGQVDCLILTGDLIHREPDDGPDRSLEIVLDVLALRERYGDAIVYLCGNHELPHIYGFVLGKGPVEYTSAFEAALSRHSHAIRLAAVLYLHGRRRLYHARGCVGASDGARAGGQTVRLAPSGIAGLGRRAIGGCRPR